MEKGIFNDDLFYFEYKNRISISCVAYLQKYEYYELVTLDNDISKFEKWNTVSWKGFSN